MNIYFVLVKPAVPENIGAAARAMKTMGFSQLRIVDSLQYQQKKARILAHGATDVLDNVQHFNELSAAVADVDLVVGTSAKRRLGKRFNYSAPDLKQLIVTKGDAVSSVAIVFGCEESGLSNKELDCCDVLSSIPIASSYPSLNLSQAVMIYAYSLTAVTVETETPLDGEQASWQVLKQKLAIMMQALDVSPGDKLYRWATERLAVLTKKDVDFLHILLDKLKSR